MTTRGNKTVNKEDCDKSMEGMRKSLKYGVATLIAIVATVTPVSAGVFSYFVNQNNEKVNKIAVASIKSDERLSKDIKEVRDIAVLNAKHIAAQDAKYNSDMKWIISTLTTIKDDIKEIKKKRP